MRHRHPHEVLEFIGQVHAAQTSPVPAPLGSIGAVPTQSQVTPRGGFPQALGGAWVDTPAGMNPILGWLVLIIAVVGGGAAGFFSSVRYEEYRVEQIQNRRASDIEAAKRRMR